jgi:hypothetical protein
MDEIWIDDVVRHSRSTTNAPRYFSSGLKRSTTTLGLVPIACPPSR